MRRSAPLCNCMTGVEGAHYVWLDACNNDQSRWFSFPFSTPLSKLLHAAVWIMFPDARVCVCIATQVHECFRLLFLCVRLPLLPPKKTTAIGITIAHVAHCHMFAHNSQCVMWYLCATMFTVCCTCCCACSATRSCFFLYCHVLSH